jgi:hypothetical protein
MIDKGVVADLDQMRKLQKGRRKNLYVFPRAAQLCAPHEITARNQRDKIRPAFDNLKQHFDQIQTSKENLKLDLRQKMKEPLWIPSAPVSSTADMTRDFALSHRT